MDKERFEVQTAANTVEIAVSSSFQVQNAANNKENEQNRESKKYSPNGKKIPKQFQTHIWM